MVCARQTLGITRSSSNTSTRDSGGEGRRPEGGQAHPRRKAHATRSPEGEKRGRDWRPGGEHRDPRQQFIDANKRRNAAQRKERWEKEKERATEERPAPRRPARRPFDPRTRHRKGPRR